MKLFFFDKRSIFRLILALVLFLAVFCIFAIAIDKIWFREDDLGTIFNGLVTDWHNALRVFKTDCRSFITPCNYQRTVPNFISALWRPVQNYIFSAVFYIFGADAKAYFLLQIGFHAANVTLFFIFCSIFMPLGLAFLSGLMLAFYPNVNWMIWASTLQNSLALFFSLLMALSLWRFWQLKRSRFWYLLAGVFYLLSLLSREMAILLPFWLALGVFIFLMPNQDKFISKCIKALISCWIFFAANVVYTLLRMWAFGFGTLDRTISNLFLRFPFLNKFVLQKAVVVDTVNTNMSAAASTLRATTALPQTLNQNNIASRLWTEILKWINAIFNFSIQSNLDKFVALAAVLIILIFIFWAYRNQKLLLLWLACGAAFVAWPGVLTYPSARYINLVYSFLIFIFFYGIYIFAQASNLKSNKIVLLNTVRPSPEQCRRIEGLTERVLFTLLLLATVLHGLLCLHQNITELNSMSLERFIYKKRFDDFFAKHKFDKNVNFVLVDSPFVSDIQSIFQFYLNNLATQVAFDPFTSLAENGIMGCGKDYKIIGVKSEIIKIPDGFRLISHDKQHCGWWLRHSNFPVAWSASERAYRWTSRQYVPNVWYECSVGKFMIHNMTDSDCVTDMSIIYDSQWINKNTVFVAWNTALGEYYIVNV